ncbi:MAG: phosphoenolpyruvate carboxylase, partial [Gammaproteobacteria bacterium]
NYAELDESKKVNHLLNLELDLDIDQFEDPFEQELLRSFSVIGQIQASNGPEGCHRYVISNTRSVLDIIHVFVLARQLLNDQTYPALDIVPLFETIEDLAAAPKIMSTLYALPEYRKQLDSRGNKQTIMLGFSDGTKDGGYLQANWSIYRAKESLTNVAREQGIKVVFFDGRGGPPGRGGGNTHDFYASHGKSIAREEVQITVQGQTVSSNFGRYASCKYNLEQLLCAGIDGDVFKSRGDLEKTEIALLANLAAEGYKAYLELKEHPKFVPYLQYVTPLSFFAETKISSRPVKRGQSNEMRFEDLRAIPFVGSWAQMKQNVPGFYGVGSALLALKQAGRLDELKSMYRLSLFFRTLLSNSMMSLTKCFYPATAYLLDDEEYSQFWQLLYNEYELSKAMILEVSGLPELMSSTPANRDSVKLREKIVLPLITIQQFALQHLRKMDKDEIKQEAIYKKVVLRCMFGIVNAGRNAA